MFPANPQEILYGQRMFRPFIRYQKSWMKYFYPNDVFSLHENSWFYLQKYMLPLIYQHASSYHLRGIECLKLNNTEQPNFNEFQELFYKASNGFTICPVDGEIEPVTYFQLIRNKKFPCIATMRTLDEVFCANEPDFWHEAIGHIAPLCHARVQEFYQEIAEYLLAASSSKEFNHHLAVAWTLTEYGFILEKDQCKMFGAALVGSHLANMRYLKGAMALEPADRTAILHSGFFEEKKDFARNAAGLLRFFYLKNFNLRPLFEKNNP